MSGAHTDYEADESSDGMHLNGIGYEFMYRSFKDALDTLPEGYKPDSWAMSFKPSA